MATHSLNEKYFSAIRARDVDALAALFADDAVMILPDGRELSGAASIAGMYTHLFSMNPPFPTPVASIASAEGVATEIEAWMEDGAVRRTANFFHLNAAGLIQRLSVYRRDG